MHSEPPNSRLFVAQGAHDHQAPAPHDRASQILNIARLLGECGLAAWTHPLLTLLDTYADIEVFAPSDDPLPAVCALLQGYRLRPAAPRGGKVADDLCQLQVLLYGAGWFTSGSDIAVLTWNPVQMTFREFKALHAPRGVWKAWKASNIQPSVAEVRRHLVANYVKVNGFV